MLELINNPRQTQVEQLTHFLQYLCVQVSLFNSVVGYLKLAAGHFVHAKTWTFPKFLTTSAVCSCSVVMET